VSATGGILPPSVIDFPDRDGGSGEIVTRVACSQLFDAMPSYISIQDRDHRIIQVNNRFKERFDCRVGDYCHTACKQQDEPCSDCPVEKTFWDGEVHQIEDTLQDRSGTEIDVLTRTSPIHSSNGEIVAVMKVASDITELKQLQRRLAQSREQYKNLFESVPCYISVQNKGFRILEANNRFKEEFGDRVGDRCHRVCKGRDEPCSFCPVAQTFADGGIHSSEEEMVTKKRESRNLIVYTAPIVDANGNVTEVMKMSTDITDVKVLQQHLASLGEMVASVSHNIKDVLGGLGGGLYMARSGLERGNSERALSGLDTIERNMRRISSQARDVLYYTKERVPQRVGISVDELIGDVIQLHDETSRSSGITVEADVRSCPLRFLADPSALHLALTNLVANAIDACKEDQSKPGHRVTISVYTDNSDVVFEVSDDGCGIPDEVKPHIFERFFSTKGVDGTGMGLLVVQKIVHEHGGMISFHSEFRSGSTFMMHFPIAMT